MFHSCRSRRTACTAGVYRAARAGISCKCDSRRGASRMQLAFGAGSRKFKTWSISEMMMLVRRSPPVRGWGSFGNQNGYGRGPCDYAFVSSKTYGVMFTAAAADARIERLLFTVPHVRVPRVNATAAAAQVACKLPSEPALHSPLTATTR
jgi:hypothetical protein